uniref:TSA: Wollemia nobilis Ref_Wollemi_Transcript_6215_1392 transcribed RNA sequence n=1 Tax=Wollemia nobilis TaxID=56998 RepID=A0A0C9RP68_9CONI
MEAGIYQYQSNSLYGDYSMPKIILLFTSVLAGILMCKIFYYATKIITPWYFKGYHKLTKAQQIEWNNRGFSTAHAILVSVVSIYLLFVSDIFRDNVQDVPVTLRNTMFSTFILGVSMGYFLADLGMILWLYPSLGGKEYVLHHLLSMIAIALSLFSGQGQMYIYLVLLSESTTPGINLRWYLDTAGQKNSKAYIINGVAMFFAWLFARIILFIYLFVHMYQHYEEVKLIFPAGFYFLFIAPPILALMNMYWFLRITIGLKKTVSKRA